MRSQGFSTDGRRACMLRMKGMGDVGVDGVQVRQIVDLSRVTIPESGDAVNEFSDGLTGGACQLEVPLGACDRLA
ncbi:hypothetical protein ASE08_20910 [Rhizobacter sp. Root16D2]|nr:hypothetical protein ASC88_22920 [Rhizobacter sp. Root29]KQW12708.1 hypothetical protein ASC98_19160 [Rhizobacter sp. Root1238]KRB22295.1 hypothetical protein ASE08_20910 [Rhizobacter sp. Root16D2]